MPKSEEFIPAWCEQKAPARSWRSLFKYGDPQGFKHPNRGLFRLIKESFHMTDADFQKPSLKMDLFTKEIPVRLAVKHVAALTKIVGEQNIHTETYLRTRASYGAGMLDALRLRNEIIENLPDLVSGRAARQISRRSWAIAISSASPSPFTAAALGLP